MSTQTYNGTELRFCIRFTRWKKTKQNRSTSICIPIHVRLCNILYIQFFSYLRFSKYTCVLYKCYKYKFENWKFFFSLNLDCFKALSLKLTSFGFWPVLLPVDFYKLNVMSVINQIPWRLLHSCKHEIGILVIETSEYLPILNNYLHVMVMPNCV